MTQTHSAAYIIDRCRSYGANPRSSQVLRDLLNDAADALEGALLEKVAATDRPMFDPVTQNIPENSPEIMAEMAALPVEKLCQRLRGIYAIHDGVEPRRFYTGAVSHEAARRVEKLNEEADFILKRAQRAEEKIVRVDEAMKLIEDCGQFDGGHHKQWVLDQVARVLLGDKYDAWVVSMKAGEDGPDTYGYDVGIAP